MKVFSSRPRCLNLIRSYVWVLSHFSSVQLLNHVWLFVTPWTAALQASLSITNSRSLLKLMSIESVMPSNHLIILGISELKWTGMGKFNSDNSYIYYCGQESLRRSGVAFIVNKRVQNAVLGCNIKNDRMISVHFQGSITVIQVLPQPLTRKKLKLNSSMMTYKNF